MINGRRFRRAAVLIVLIWSFVFATGNVVQAQDSVCTRDPTTKVVTCTIVSRADPGGPEILVDLDGNGGLPVVWERRRSNGLPGATFTCAYEITDGTTTTQVFGVGWAVFVTNTETLEIQFAGFVCEYPGEDPPQPPPPPPDLDRVVEDQRQVLALETGLSPSAERRGVSQLPTWFWCNGPQSTSLDLSLDGYQIAAEVGIESVVWAIDGPDGLTERGAPRCGAEPAIDSSGEAAAATWTPNESGESVIVLTTTWSGAWTLTYTDPTFGAVDLGSFDLGTLEVDSEPVLYDVYEIQTVGVGP